MLIFILFGLMCFNSQIRCKSISEIDDAAFIRRIALDEARENPHAYKKPLSPVILIPGLGGNSLYATLNRTSTSHAWCHKNEDIYTIWLNLFFILPISRECYIDNLRLLYNNVTRRTRNLPGVEIKTPKFGHTRAMEFILKDTKIPLVRSLDAGAYFRDIADALVSIGYIRQKSLFGAPYDFRKGPNENEEWFVKLESLTEDAYERNNNTAVTFIAHSLGGKMLLNFLHNMPPRWKDKYVKRIITLATPWAGSVRAIQALSIGYNLGNSFINSQKMKEIEKTYPSIVWLIPSEKFWKSHDVIVSMNNKNYTTRNIEEFLYDIGESTVVEMKKDLLPYNNFTAPGVETHCLFGNVNGSVVGSLKFGKTFNYSPLLSPDNGDGTVNRRSLIGCELWKKTNANRNVYVQEFQHIDHTQILKDYRVIGYIKNVLLERSHTSRKNITNIKLD